MPPGLWVVSYKLERLSTPQSLFKTCLAAAIMIAVKHFDTVFLSQPAALGLFIAFIAVAGLTIISLTLLSIRRWSRNRHAGGSSEIEMKEINGTHRVVTVTVTPELQEVFSNALPSFIF